MDGNDALIVLAASLGRELRLNGVNNLGSADAAADTHDAAAVATGASRTLSCAVARTDASAKTEAETIGAALALRSHRNLLRVGSAEVRHLIVLRHADRSGGLQRHLRKLNLGRLQGNDGRLGDNLGQGSPDRCDQLVCTPAASATPNLNHRHHRRWGWIVESELNGRNDC